MNDLYIDLSKIVKADGSSIEVKKEFPKEAFPKDFLKFTSSVLLVGKISNEAGNLTIDGKLLFSCEHDCDRCLDVFSKDYKVEFSDIIAKEGENGEFIPYSNNRVLLVEPLYKYIFFETENKHLCKEECKGLCGICGADLNETDCNCGKDEIDPRLLKLKELFDS